MKFEYYPWDVATVLVELGGGNNKTVDELTNALYHIKALCENEYNSDYWRVFYKTLEEITRRNSK